MGDPEAKTSLNWPRVPPKEEPRDEFSPLSYESDFPGDVESRSVDDSLDFVYDDMREIFRKEPFAVWVHLNNTFGLESFSTMTEASILGKSLKSPLDFQLDWTT